MKIRNLKLTIEYDGTDFNGWQIQSGKSRTVQGELEKTFYKITRKKARVIGSGRTDANVHAKGQIASVKIATRLTDPELLRALNGNLPPDVAILKIKTLPDTFHAQYSAKRKTYRYTIHNSPIPCVLDRRFATHIPQKLDHEAMRREAKYLLGKKDFRSFMATDRSKKGQEKTKDTIRHIYHLKINKKGNILQITIEANGFLYKMVRNIVGTLVEVGKNNLPKGSVLNILEKKDRKLAPRTAPAHGLCLLKVRY